MSKDFLLGLATLPALAASVVVAGRLSQMLGRWWTRLTPEWVKGAPGLRTRMAASVAVARRLWRVKVLGGWVVVYHSSVMNDEQQYWAPVHDALVDHVYTVADAQARAEEAAS